jgi:hypothetical protein
MTGLFSWQQPSTRRANILGKYNAVMIAGIIGMFA